MSKAYRQYKREGEVVKMKSKFLVAVDDGSHSRIAAKHHFSNYRGGLITLLIVNKAWSPPAAEYFL
jgi:hypothetical protein